MHYINKNGKIFQSQVPPTVHVELPKGSYVIKFDQQFKEYYLETVPNFEVTGKVYGDLSAYKDDIYHAYTFRKNSTGIALKGEIGSGKTLLAKMVAGEFVTRGGIVIIINDEFYDTSFLQFLHNIEQEHMLLFEEFDKVYDLDDDNPNTTVNTLLSLFDGIFSKRRLIMLTLNNELPKYMRKRPSRILYDYQFNSISNDIIDEICKDYEVPELMSQLHVVNSLYSLNFDSCISLIAEYLLRQKQRTLYDIIDYLNCIIDDDAHKTVSLENYTISNIVYTDDSITDVDPNTFTVYLNGDSNPNTITDKNLTELRIIVKDTVCKDYDNISCTARHITNITDDTCEYTVQGTIEKAVTFDMSFTVKIHSSTGVFSHLKKFTDITV